MITARQVFHLGCVIYYVIISQWIKENAAKNEGNDNLDPVIKTMKLYPLRYLTNWTFTLQYIYFFIALGEEGILLIRGQEKIKEKVNKFKNYLFTVLAAPMAMMVTITFWSFWLVDRELIFPIVMDKVIPAWMNHSLHTTTSALVLLEIYLCFHKYPTFRAALLGITLYLLFYLFCFLGTYFQSGVWLYPVFKTISWTLRIVFFLAVYVLAVGIYGAGYISNQLIWDEKSVVKKAPKKKHKKH